MNESTTCEAGRLRTGDAMLDGLAFEVRLRGDRVVRATYYGGPRDHYQRVHDAVAYDADGDPVVTRRITPWPAVDGSAAHAAYAENDAHRPA